VDEFVPRDFDVPRRLETPRFVLEPLGPEHNEQDYDAWTSSMDHIAATPGWGDGRWPREMTPDENRADLQRHADDFRNRTGFTYTVLDPANRDLIGCVYIYPLPNSDDDARALSWVRASHAELDVPLWRAVSDWLASDWPFGSVPTTLHPTVMSRFRTMFGVPEDVGFHFCVPLGYPQGNFGPNVRKPTSETTFLNHWSAPVPWK